MQITAVACALSTVSVLPFLLTIRKEPSLLPSAKASFPDFKLGAHSSAVQKLSVSMCFCTNSPLMSHVLTILSSPNEKSRLFGAQLTAETISLCTCFSLFFNFSFIIIN